MPTAPLWSEKLRVWPAETGQTGIGVERSPTGRCHLGAFEAPAEGEFGAADSHFFVEEKRRTVGIDFRQEGFFSEGREIDAGKLHPEGAGEWPQLGVGRLDPAFIALVFEGGRHGTTLQFLMLVIGVAVLELHGFDEGAQFTHFPGGIPTGTLHIETDVRFGHRAVIGLEVGIGDAHIPVVESER